AAGRLPADFGPEVRPHGVSGDLAEARVPRGGASSFVAPPLDAHPVLQQQAREQAQQVHTHSVAVIGANVWKKIDKLRRAKICLNCRQQPQRISNASGAPSGVCSGCTRHVGRQHCKHCGIEFLQHHYCAQAEKLLGRPICLGCARQLSKYRKDPSICRYCKCWSAWNEAQECERCRSRIQRHGMPRRCEKCGVEAAFPRASTPQEGEKGETQAPELLCFLCAFAAKKALLLQQRSKIRAQQTLQLLQPGRVDAAALELDHVPRGLLSGRRETLGQETGELPKEEDSAAKPASFWKQHAQTLQQQNEEFLQQLQQMQQQLLHKDLAMQEQQQEKKEQQQALQQDLLQEKRRNQQLLLDLKRASAEQEAQAAKAAADQRRTEETHLGLSNALHECIDQLKRKNEELELENKRCTLEAQQLKRQNHALVREAENARKELSSATSARDSALSSREAANSEISALEAALSAAQKELTETQKKLAALETELAAAHAEVYKQRRAGVPPGEGVEGKRELTDERERERETEEKADREHGSHEHSGEEEENEREKDQEENGAKGEAKRDEKAGEETDEKEGEKEKEEKEEKGEAKRDEKAGEETDDKEGEKEKEKKKEDLLSQEAGRKGVSGKNKKRRLARGREANEENGEVETVERRGEATIPQEKAERDPEGDQGGAEPECTPACTDPPAPEVSEGAPAAAETGESSPREEDAVLKASSEDETGKKNKRKRRREDSTDEGKRHAAEPQRGDGETKENDGHTPIRDETERETETTGNPANGQKGTIEAAPEENGEKEESGTHGEAEQAEQKEDDDQDDEETLLADVAATKISKRGGRKASVQRRKPKAKVRLQRAGIDISNAHVYLFPLCLQLEPLESFSCTSAHIYTGCLF
ncbi:hypothetical protein TGPRC2_209280B, partial [Toxoplasma gondii TgCatPRC2]